MYFVSLAPPLVVKKRSTEKRQCAVSFGGAREEGGSFGIMLLCAKTININSHNSRRMIIYHAANIRRDFTS